MKKRIYKGYETAYPEMTYEGERLENKIERIIENNEPITDSVKMSYTKRSDGVRPEFDIRTDKWDVALETMDKVAEAKKNKIKEKMKEGLHLPKEKETDLSKEENQTKE